jgi:hypothetical protein
MRDLDEMARWLSKAGAGALAAAALVLSGCGGGGSPATAGSNSPATAASPAGPGGGPFASLTASQRSCLAKQGVSPPDGRRNGQGPPNGQPPSGTNGQPPADGPGRDPARFQKLQAALKKCGVSLPGRPPGGGAPGQSGTATGPAQN